jgi:hypothetical protein
MSEATHDWRWFNRGEMAVKRTDTLTYTVWRWSDKEGWGAAIDFKMENQIVKDIGIAVADTWEAAVEAARLHARDRLDSLKTELERKS